jgi:hypothetical protein
VSGYWRTGGHDDAREHDRPERLDRQADKGHGYGHIDPDTISDESLLSFFGVKSWDEYIERHQSDDPIDLDDYEPPDRRDRPAAEQERRDVPTAEKTTDSPVEVEQPESTKPWRTIAEEIGQQKEYRSYSAAKRELGSIEGTELHHIVEQSQIKPERSGLSVERVNSADNLTRIPVEKHREISAFYSSKPPGFDSKVRDSLNGESWDTQYDFGSRALDRVFDEGDDDDD